MNLQRIAAWLQFDKSLSITLLTRMWQAISGPLTLALMAAMLDAHELGVFYGVLGMVAIQPLFELGFGSVLIGQAGNLVGSNQRPTTGLSAPPQHMADSQLGLWQLELWRLSRAATQWFGLIAVLYGLSAVWIGWKILSGSAISLIDWRWPLVLSVGLAAVSLLVSSRVCILEGAGQREHIYRVRLCQALVGSLTMWAALWWGWKLWAIVAVFAVGAMFQLWLAFGPRAQRLLGFGLPWLTQLKPLSAPHGVSVQTPSSRTWLAKLAPLQWRAAASSAAHFLASQLMVQYVLNYHGATTVAPLGMTLQVTVAVQALALAWAQTNFPLIASYTAAGQRERAGTLWRQTTLVSGGLLLAAMLGMAGAVGCLALANRGWENYFVAPWLIVVLGIGYLANHGLALQAYYVLARGAKPLVGAAVSGLLLTAVAVWWGAKYYEVPGAICAYSFGMALVALPLHSWAYLGFRKQIADIA